MEGGKEGKEWGFKKVYLLPRKHSSIPYRATNPYDFQKMLYTE
jgi:hypothetical protein